MKPETATANYASAAKVGAENCPGPFVGLYRSVRGREILANQAEKNRISQKTWYRAVFQIGQFEVAANQNDATKTERNRSLKFLGFSENFSGVYIPPVDTMMKDSAVAKAMADKEVYEKEGTTACAANLPAQKNHAFGFRGRSCHFVPQNKKGVHMKLARRRRRMTQKYKRGRTMLNAKWQGAHPTFWTAFADV